MQARLRSYCSLRDAGTRVKAPAPTVRPSHSGGTTTLTQVDDDAAISRRLLVPLSTRKDVGTKGSCS